jgi:Uma2 family endonuclease
MDDTRVLPARRRVDSESYYRMAEAGIFAQDERVELIEGDMIDMAPIGQGHEAVVNGLNRALVLACGERAIVSTQNSIRFGQWSAPQPDFAVLRPRSDFYATGERAGPADVLLLVEVADTSLRFDRTVKLPLYARAGIAEFWLVDLPRRAIDVYRGPSGDGYAAMTTHVAGDAVALALAPEIVVRLAVVFG